MSVGDRVITDEGEGVVVALDLDPDFPYPQAVQVSLDSRPELPSSWFDIRDVRVEPVQMRGGTENDPPPRLT